MKKIAIVQARMGSTRLPNKVMRPILGTPMIEFLLKRLSKANKLDQIIIATSTAPENKVLTAHIKKLGFDIFQGNETDVLGRYYKAAKQFRADIIVRITGDCPLIDPELVDQLLTAFEEKKVDYLSNTHPPTFPDGLDVEVFSFKALKKAALEAVTPYDREHVTPFIKYSGKFNFSCIRHQKDLSNKRWTVDEYDDFKVIEDIVRHFHPRLDFTWTEILELSLQQPELFSHNTHLIRDEGSQLNTGQKLWKRAKRVIPGGNMLLSKRPEMFLPNQWPAYFKKAKGCKIWDLDDVEYTDISFMGIGTNILGYGEPEVDEAVSKVLTNGNMSTLNCPEEVLLAEKLIELHPWADMVRLARSGGEANTIAIRIARAAVGKTKVAFCGYHGWHDWYLAANIADESHLGGHLLPGLKPKGIPDNLKETIFPFSYNDFEGLEQLTQRHDIGIIKMEVSRNYKPKNNFLEKIRQLADEKGLILIFDECSSGFRQALGGLHKHYGVEPDMAVFGKALGNGYAITATIGRRKIMEAAQNTFISSTFWTERIGPCAALKTLEIMERTASWKYITQLGHKIGKKWKTLAEKHELSLNIFGLPAMISFGFPCPNAIAYKTLISQEMLKKGYLAGTSIYVSTAHTEQIITEYIQSLDSVFKLIKECENGRDVMTLLKGPVCHDGFKRLA